MSIIIGRVENKFWSNNDHKVPNAFPIYEEQKELKDAEPNMSDFMSGTIYLFGDQWNHCLYKGAYYALYILQVLDEDKKYYCYRLERELWFDVLKAKPRVVGDLINSNNDELLEKNLNRTIGVLDHPAQVVTINFGKIDFDWRKNFTYKGSNKKFEQVVLSKNNLDSFFAAATDEYTKDWKNVNKDLYDGNRNPGVFLFSYIAPALESNGWKNLLLEKIDGFIRSLEIDEGKNYKISKVSTAEGSKLQGNYCITSKVEGIGTTEDTVKLTTIDLSGLEDIVPVTFHTPDIEMEPFVPLNEGVKGGVFDLVGEKQVPFPFLAKIRRRAYLPIGAPSDRRPEDRGFGFSHPDFNWSNVRSPQKVQWAWAGYRGTGLLWYVENLNFSADFNPSGESEIIITGGGGGGGGGAGGGGVSGGPDVRIEDRYKDLTFFKKILPWGSSHVPYKYLEGPLFNFGFLVLGLYKDSREWKLFQYNGDIALEKIVYVAGINKSFLTKTREKDYWWSDLKPELAAIQPSEEFAKFYLKNYYFSWLAFFPGTIGGARWNVPGLWSDIWGTWVYTNYYYSKLGAMQTADIYDKDRNWKEGNPLSKDRWKENYPRYLQTLRNTLDSVLIKSAFELPKGLKVEKGDYFFTDVDYDIREYLVNERNYGNLTRLKEKLRADGYGQSWRNALFSVEDFVNPQASSPLTSKPSQKLILLCGTFEGNIEVRELNSFTATLTLSDQYGQIVQTVDDVKSKTVVCTLIKRLTDNLIINETSLLNASEIKEQIIYAFYTANGYKTKKIGSVGYWNWFNEDDFGPSSDQQFLFDLKGTDWYCFVAKGKISLIAKKTISFAPIKGQTESLLHLENKNLNLNLLHKINQRVRFQFFNAPYKLNWKTSFTDEDRLFLSYESLSPTELQNLDFEQYFIKLETGFDQIWYENVSIPKERQKSLSIADSVAIEALGLEKSRIQYAYQVESDRFALAQRRYEENLTRAQNNLDIQKYASWVKFGLSLATSAISVGTAAKFGGTPAVNNIFTTSRTSYRKARSKKQIEAAGEGAITAALEGGGTATYLPFTTKNTRIKKIAGKSRLPTIIPSTIGSVGNSIADLVMDQAFYFPEVQRQINVERHLGATELAIQSLGMDTSFLDRQISQQLALNRTFNVYDNPLIGEREILEKFLNKTEWHKGKKLAYAHLVVFIPSDEQLIALRSFKEEYGVMCDIPDISTTFHENMAPDVIRYRNLDDESIIGLTNPIVRDFLKVRLLAGIKIIKITDLITPALTTQYFLDKLSRLNYDLSTKTETIQTQTEKIKDLEKKIVTVTENAKQECTDEKQEIQKQLQKTIEDKEKEISDTRTLLDQKANEITQLQEGHKKEKEELEKKIKEDCEREKKVEKEQMEEAHNQKLQEFLRERDKAVAEARKSGFNSRNEEVDELKRALTDCEEGGKAAELEKKLNDYTEKEKEYCDLLKKYIQDKYEVNINEREDGGNALRDLVIEIIQEVNWMRKTNLDTKLGTKYNQLRPLLEGLMKLQEIPLVSRWQEIVDHNFYPEYLKFLKEGGDHNGHVDEIIKKVNEIKILDLENVSEAHGIKATLDELNWLSYKAKNELNEAIKNDSDLQYFFKHIYPAGSLEKYEKLFGDPNIAVTKKRFFDQMQCFKGPGDLPYTNLEVLANFERTTKISMDDINAQENQREKWQNFVPHYHGKPLSTNKEDIAVYMAPKYRKNAKNYLDSLEIIENKKYWNVFTDELKFSWVWIKGIYLERGQIQRGISRGTYFALDNNSRDVWTNIMGTRNFLWENRSRIVLNNLPENWGKEKILEFGDRDKWKMMVVTEEDPKLFSAAQEVIKLAEVKIFKITDSLFDVFGPKYIKEAAILLGIMFTNCLAFYTSEADWSKVTVQNYIANKFYKDIGFGFGQFRPLRGRDLRRQRVGDYKDTWTVLTNIQTNIMAAHQSSIELLKFMMNLTWERWLLLEFGDLWNLFSYVYRQIKLNVKRLEDPFGPDYSDTSKIDFRQILKDIYEKNRT